MKSKKVFWGIFFILAAVYVIVSKLGLLPDVGVFKILMTVLMIWLIVEGIRYLNFYEILIPLALIGIIYDEVLGITALTPWTLLTASVLLSIGLSMIFRSKKKNYTVNWDGNGDKVLYGTEQCTGEQIRCENNFGSAIRYVNSDNFKNAQVENNFGSLSVYFDNAIVQGSEAYVNVENNFGETILYIPKEWKVENNLDHTFGGINIKGQCEGTSGTTLYIKGSASFGAITIYYV